MFEKIIESVHRILQLNEEERVAFMNILNLEKFPKKQHIFKEGDYCHQIYFLNLGYARTYYHGAEEEVTTDFFSAGSWFANFNSYLTKSPSNISFQAISDVEMVMLDMSKVEKLYEMHPRLERIGRVLVEQVLVSIVEEKRMESLLPDERYLYLLHHRPDWIQNIPQKYIASYFKIQPESLSRIKSRIHHSNNV